MSAIESRSLSVSMRCYRGLLRAYPQAFLVEFEDLLCQAFGDLAHRAVRSKGHWGLFVLWMRTIPDLISSAFSQRFRTTSEWSFRLRWIFACAAGVAIGAICVFAPHQIQKWLEMRPPDPSSFVPVVPRSQPELRIDAISLLNTAILGLSLGLFQSFALGWRRYRRAAWMCATTLGVMFAAHVILLVPFVASYLRVTIHPWRLFVDQHPMMYYGGSAVFCVSVIGMIQTFLLVRRNPRALAWIPASAIGFLGCGFVMAVIGDPVFRSVHNRLAFIAVLGLIMGIVYGAVTVLPLEWILRREMAQDLRTSGSKELSS